MYLYIQPKTIILVISHHWDVRTSAIQLCATTHLKNKKDISTLSFISIFLSKIKKNKHSTLRYNFYFLPRIQLSKKKLKI